MTVSVPPVVHAPRTLLDGTHAISGTRAIPEETPVAFTYDRTTYAVMMASPVDLEDFAVGFSLTEKIIDLVSEISEIEVVDLGKGIELRIGLATARGTELEARRRRFAGPAGCGLCGIESLEAATAAPPRIHSDLRVDAAMVFKAVSALRDEQHLNAQTHAVHAAGFWSPEKQSFIAVREDVGRHNALDKLGGALARTSEDAKSGIVVMTSRVSVELVQKAARLGCPILVAVSAPTALAIRTAEEAGITIAAIARGDSFEVFTHPQRIAP
jgi:FdhD protein